MNDFHTVVSKVFNTKTTKITFVEYEQYPKMDVHATVVFKKHKNHLNINTVFFRFCISPVNPFFHSVCLSDLNNVDKFNQIFQIHKTSRKDFLFINEFLNNFQQNTNFSKFLKLSSEIKAHEFYTFANIYMLEKDAHKYGITICIHRSYRNVVQYEFIKNFSITRDGHIVLFPTVRFFNHTNSFSLYFSLTDKKVYKLPESLIGLVYLEDIVEASTLFTEQDLDLFTDEILMMYVSNLHQGIYQDFLGMPQSSLSDKIDLFLMTTI